MSYITTGQTFHDLHGNAMNREVIFHGRINGDGLTISPCKPEGHQGHYKVFCLSITHDRWIATDGFSTYVVEFLKESWDKAK